MARIPAIIDGFNLFHSLIEDGGGSRRNYAEYRWLDYWKLVKCFVTSKDTIVRVVYCTAFPIWNPQKRAKHEMFVDAQKKNGVEVVLGYFHKKDRRCHHCKRDINTHEEKQTDVNVAVSLYEMAHDDVFDVALLVTGDSDICPAVRAVKKSFPSKAIEIVMPINRPAEMLKSIADRSHRIKEHHLRTSLLPERVDLGRGRTAICPQGWMPAPPVPPSQVITVT